MSEYRTDNCLILLADSDFSVLAGKAINNQLKNELLVNAFPKGSSWKTYSGARSISFFRCKTHPDTYALTYSVITSSITTPVISFVILVDSEKAEIVISHHVKGIESIFIQKIESFFSIDNRTANILKENLLFYKALPNQEKLPSLYRKFEQQQTLFSMLYNNARQWTAVEIAILKFVNEKSSNNYLSFRTLALQKEPAFKVLGLVQKSKAQSQNTFAKSIVIFALIVLVLISALIGLLILLGIINFDNNASQQSVHLTCGILRHFRAFF